MKGMKTLISFNATEVKFPLTTCIQKKKKRKLSPLILTFKIQLIQLMPIIFKKIQLIIIHDTSS